MEIPSEQEIVHVVIAILQNNKQEVLVSRRKSDVHLAGLLEFPGGKVEKNESPESALRRELKEELNVDIINAVPLIQIPYHYSDRKILLDTYLVDDYSGSVSGHEGQEVFWKKPEALDESEFPAANYGVIRALQLPKTFPVTPNFSEDSDAFLANFENVVSNETTHVIQLRSHDLIMSDYMGLAKHCADLCEKHSVKLVLNRDIKALEISQASGLHLTSDNLLNTKVRPLDHRYLVGASCHNIKEIEHANSLRLDYMFVGPVIEKIHSVNCARLGWDGFSALSRRSVIPVYAIGGLSGTDLADCIDNGGQGVAAIREFWGANT